MVAGPTALATPAGVDAHRRAAAPPTWPTRCSTRVRDADVFVAVAAVADYTPVEPSRAQAQEDAATPLTLKLKPTVDILATVAALRIAAVLRRLRRGEPRRRRATARRSASARSCRCSSPTARRTRSAAIDNEVTLLDDAGAHPLPRMDKLALARRLVARDREAAGRQSRAELAAVDDARRSTCASSTSASATCCPRTRPPAPRAWTCARASTRR